MWYKIICITTEKTSTKKSNTSPLLITIDASWFSVWSKKVSANTIKVFYLRETNIGKKV